VTASPEEAVDVARRGRSADGRSSQHCRRRVRRRSPSDERARARARRSRR
jgi:hypothetical protein